MRGPGVLRKHALTEPTPREQARCPPKRVRSQGAPNEVDAPALHLCLKNLAPAAGRTGRATLRCGGANFG